MRDYTRRGFLATAGRAGALLLAGSGALARSVDAAGDPILAGRPLVRYPEKTDLILLTSRPPQLETPMKYFDRAITPNDAFFVRYHVFPVPTSVDLATWRLKVQGRVDRPLDLSLEDLKTKFPPARVVAVNQCSGNSRGRFAPRVLGGEWGDGAMGNAEWVGARMRDILVGGRVRQGAVQVTFDGLDKPAFPTVPDFVKSLDVDADHGDPDVIVAYQMNGQPLPMLNGYPARLIVPGWYATYWVKNLSEIEVVDHVFEKFWMKPGYRIPDTPCGCVEPGTAPARTVPISRMTVRSFIPRPRPARASASGSPSRSKASPSTAATGSTRCRSRATAAPHGAAARSGPTSAATPSASGPRPGHRRPGQHRLMVRAFNRIGESQGTGPSGILRAISATSSSTSTCRPGRGCHESRDRAAACGTGLGSAGAEENRIILPPDHGTHG